VPSGLRQHPPGGRHALTTSTTAPIPSSCRQHPGRSSSWRVWYVRGSLQPNSLPRHQHPGSRSSWRGSLVCEGFPATKLPPPPQHPGSRSSWRGSLVCEGFPATKLPPLPSALSQQQLLEGLWYVRGSLQPNSLPCPQHSASSSCWRGSLVCEGFPATNSPVSLNAVFCLGQYAARAHRIRSSHKTFAHLPVMWVCRCSSLTTMQDDVMRPGAEPSTGHQEVAMLAGGRSQR
jgi:hypothetical protein